MGRKRSWNSRLPREEMCGGERITGEVGAVTQSPISTRTDSSTKGTSSAA